MSFLTASLVIWTLVVIGWLVMRMALRDRKMWQLILAPTTYFVIHDEGAYFRIFNYGLHMVSRNHSRLCFSERMGLRKVLHVGPLCFRVLKPKDSRQ
jgi:hypothetical protein